MTKSRALWIALAEAIFSSRLSVKIRVERGSFLLQHIITEAVQVQVLIDFFTAVNGIIGNN